MSDPNRSTKPRLRANAIGIVAAATLGIVFMSPAFAFYGNWGPVASTVGSPTPTVWDEEADSVDPDAAVPGVPEAGVAS